MVAFHELDDKDIIIAPIALHDFPVITAAIQQIEMVEISTLSRDESSGGRSCHVCQVARVIV